ncbi:MAG: SDR family NAD(P)-dependent oxidoreductase [Myxococcota bacterium]|jgi:NAD(P)-dependent dehydrogenase (short-subunit alcohol dehydrogenase family)|tara:strand:+ start:217 stop:1119 length:903 start_codon:yes stop_codon:yes gene_type:complete
MGKLDGRVAIVTGAGQGIGAEVARTFAAEGASVVVNDLGANLDGSSVEGTPAEEVAKSIVDAGGKAAANNCNVTDSDAVKALTEQAIDEFGKLDIVVNVAGILRDSMIFKMEESQWDAVIAVHLKGTYNTIRHASEYWRANRGGEYRIINFISGSGLWGAPAQPNYAAAKMGIVGLSNSCATALNGYGVTANCIAPVAYTRMTASLEGKATVMDYSPNNEKISTKNVVPPVVWLAAEESAWMNGRIIQCGNGRIGLITEPSVEREVTTPGVWDMDVAFEEMNTSFKEAVVYPNPFRKPKG